MKLYVHKHIAFDLDTWEIIQRYMHEIKADNFTEFIKNVVMEKIKMKTS